MTVKPRDIPINEARRLFLQADDGSFRYRIKSGKRDAGDNAGSLTLLGYLLLSMGGQQYMAHRVAWALHHNAQPPEVIDHINGDRLDNRIENLREATTAQNAANCGVRKHNRSGFKGAYKCHKTGRWMANITINGKPKNLGRYDTPQEAHAVWLDAARTAHGEFARAE